MYKHHTILKIKFILLYLFFIFNTLHTINAYTILLAPTGHEGDPGRSLHTSNERALTYQWAQALQAELLRRHPTLHVILSRSPGETLLPLQLVSFANRLMPNIIISFHLYKEESEKPQLYLYHHSTNRLLESSIIYENSLTFVPLEKAHFDKKKNTLFLIKTIENSLKQLKDASFFKWYPTQGFPFKPFHGMMYPSIALELGISKDTQWKDTVQPLAEALESYIF